MENVVAISEEQNVQLIRRVYTSLLAQLLNTMYLNGYKTKTIIQTFRTAAPNVGSEFGFVVEARLTGRWCQMRTRRILKHFRNTVVSYGVSKSAQCEALKVLNPHEMETIVRVRVVVEDERMMPEVFSDPNLRTAGVSLTSTETYQLAAVLALQK